MTFHRPLTSLFAWLLGASLVVACSDSEPAATSSVAGDAAGQGGQGSGQAGQTGQAGQAGDSGASGGKQANQAGAGGQGAAGSTAGSAGAAGSAGSAGSAGAAGASGGSTAAAPKAGEYDVVVDAIEPLGSEGNLPAQLKGMHLSLRDEGGKLTAQVMAAFGTAADYDVTFQPDVPLAVPMGVLSNAWKANGPLLLTASTAKASFEGDPYATLAFSLDEQGRPAAGVAHGYHTDAVAACNQIKQGDGLYIALHAQADTTPPAAKGGENLLPWEAKIALSEPAMINGDLPYTGEGLVSLETGPDALLPRFGDLLALSGKKVTISVPSLIDRAGNMGAAEATLSFVDLGQPAPSFDFSTPGQACSGVALGAVPFARIVSKPGATKAKVALCASASKGGTGQNKITVEAWSASGQSQVAAADLQATQSTTVEIALPEGTSAVGVRSQGCSLISVTSIEAF